MKDDENVDASPDAPDLEISLQQLDESYVLGNITQADYERARQALLPPQPVADISQRELRATRKTNRIRRVLVSLLLLFGATACWIALSSVAYGLRLKISDSVDAGIIITDIALAVRPSAEIYLTRERIHVLKGMYAEAVADLDGAIRLDPDNTVLYTKQSSLSGLVGQYDKAIADANEVIRLEVETGECLGYIVRASAYSNRESYPEALADTTTALELDHVLASRQGYSSTCMLASTVTALGWKGKEAAAALYSNRSFSLLKVGRYAEAIAEAEQWIALDPQNSIAYNNRGKAYSLQGQYEQALADYDKAIELLSSETGNARMYCNRGIAHQALGSKLEAIADFEQCLKLSPEAEDQALAERSLQELRNQP